MPFIFIVRTFFSRLVAHPNFLYCLKEAKSLTSSPRSRLYTARTSYFSYFLPTVVKFSKRASLFRYCRVATSFAEATATAAASNAVRVRRKFRVNSPIRRSRCPPRWPPACRSAPSTAHFAHSPETNDRLLGFHGSVSRGPIRKLRRSTSDDRRPDDPMTR